MTNLRKILVAASLALPLYAMTARTGGNRVLIPQGETLEDSLFASGETVRIDGVVDGDVIAFAQRIEIRGTVTGSVMLWAQNVDVRGEVKGTLIGFAQNVLVSGTVGRNVIAAAQNVRLDRTGLVNGDLVGFGATVTSEGTVSRGVRAYSGTGTMAGGVGRDVEFYGGELRVEDSARITGNVRARVSKESDLYVAGGAKVGGTVDKRLQEPAAPASPIARVLWEGLWLAAMMLTGWVLWRVAPRVVEGSVRNVATPWPALGMGFVLLVAAPVALVIVALTVIGLPMALMGGALYLTAVYLSRMVVAVWLGQRVMARFAGGAGNHGLILLSGLAIVSVVFAIPLVGLVAKLIATCLGLGAFAWYGYRALRPTPLLTPDSGETAARRGPLVLASS
ncbi:MAG: polymer-forming cytoskeletal protein [Bryobacteraceae bacterium]|nr:polymer-forming cytoskeletal protein [Bryobacteraceae bacterium]